MVGGASVAVVTFPFVAVALLLSLHSDFNQCNFKRCIPYNLHWNPLQDFIELKYNRNSLSKNRAIVVFPYGALLGISVNHLF